MKQLESKDMKIIFGGMNKTELVKALAPAPPG